MADQEIAAALGAERTATLVRAAALARQVAGLAEEQALTSHDDEHDPEGATIAYERAQLQGLIAGARREIEALDRAVERLRAGTYGACEVCGGPIGAARLEALPAVGTCITCTGRRPGRSGARARQAGRLGAPGSSGPSGSPG